jgi:hypothetical protein
MIAVGAVAHGAIALGQSHAKSLFRLASPVGGAPGDEAAGEVEHGEVVLGFLRPADQDRSVAVEPGVGALDDPAAGTEAGLALERLRLVAATADVRGERELRRELTHLAVVVAAVEA